MKKIYINICSALFVAATLTSCGDFLEETSQDEFKPETVEDYQEILNGEGYGLTTAIDPITHVFTDDVQGANVGSNTYYYTDDNLAFKDVYTWQSNMDQLLKDKNKTGYYNSYQNLYKLIMACNTVLGEVDKASGTDAEHKQTKGEALALRAFYYWYLVNLYAMPYNMAGTTPDKLAGVPLVTSAEIKNDGPSRASVAAVYAQISKDVEDACALLEQTKETSISKYRINWVAANLLASRVYLYMENWDKVIEHADKALEGSPSMCDLNSYQLTIPSNYKPNQWNNFYEYASNNFVSASFPETIFAGGTNTKVAIAGSLLCVSDSIIKCFKSNDLRKEFMLKATPYMFYPYMEIKAGTSERGYAWRTSELYLNRAEAYAEKFAAGDAASGQKAVDDINMIRRNRIAKDSYVPSQLGSAAELIDLIRGERRLELCFENPHRWFDLRRYGMPEITHDWYDKTGTKTTFTLEKNDVGYALPFPLDATTNNKNLEQNPLHAERVAK